MLLGMDLRSARLSPMRPPLRRLPSMRMPWKRLLHACVLLAAPLAALLALVAPTSAAAQTVTMNRGGEDLRIAVGDAAALPADFPTDVALPPVHTVLRVDRSDGDTTVVVATPGTVEAEAARFRAGMLADGWTAAALVPPATGQGQAWVKGARVVLAWLVPAEAGGVRVQLRLFAKH